MLKIDERFRSIIAIAFEKDISEVHHNMNQENTPKWDSLKQMNVIVALEEEFKISFDEAEAILLKDFTSLLDAVTQKSAK